MYEFIRGNNGSLEGKASIYVAHKKSPGKDEEREYYAYRIGHSLLDIIFPGEEFLDAEEILEQEQKLKKNLKINGKEVNLLLYRPFTFEDTNYLDGISGDIVFAGNVAKPDFAGNLLEAASSMYSFDYQYQLSQRINGNGVKREVPKEDFHLLDEQGLVARLSALTIDLYGSRATGDKKKRRIYPCTINVSFRWCTFCTTSC